MRLALKETWFALALLTGALCLAGGCRNSVRALPDSPIASAALGVPACDCCWTTAVDEPGLPNFYKVSDVLYRGAQPTHAGLSRLPALGFKTVLNVRLGDTDSEQMKDVPVAYEHWPMSALTMGDDEVVRFLALMNEKDRLPVFVHCHHGADRTGMLCAMYRVAIQGWAKEDAIAEMTCGGMQFSSMFQNLVTYVSDADIEELRRRAGLEPSHPSQTKESLALERARQDSNLQPSASKTDALSN